MYPEQIPPEVVVENSTLANKEVIAGQIKPAQSVQRSAASPSTKLRTGGQKKTKKETSKPFRPTVDFVNVIS